jgi:hypothetical protein
MPITREQWIDVEGATMELWDKESKKRPDFNAMLYNVQESDKSQENHLGVGSIGQMSPWTGSVSYAEFKKGFSKGYRHAKYSRGIQFEEELFRFSEYNEMRKRTSKLNVAVYKTLQAHGVSTFNNAFDATFAGPDTVALCSASHPYSPSDTTLQSNLFTLDLSVPNLNTVFNAMSDFRDDQGDMLMTTPNVLLTGMYYRADALKICGPKAGDKEPGMADNDENIWKDDLTYVYHPMITGKKWFLLDRDLMNDMLNWYNARVPAIKTEVDFDTEVQKYACIGMWSYGFDDWSFCAGSNAS